MTKEEQKDLIIQIMQEDEKDGLYEETKVKTDI